MKCHDEHHDHAAHDEHHDDHSVIDAAIAHCKKNGHRVTDPRVDVLRVLIGARKPIGAYDIIAAMPQKTKPPTVYRALEFWQAQGFVHRIDSLNVYTFCHAGHRHEGSQFMVCDTCGTIEEMHMCNPPAPLLEEAAAKHFKMRRWNAELHGTCVKCATSA
jgi:Fur family zinc uptake transcriptional regulator